MSVLMMLEVPGGTVEQYDRVNEILGIAGDEDAPDGLIYHAAARTDDGIVVADLWRSAEDCERFFEERAGAAIAESGMPEPKQTVAEVHKHIDGTGSEPGVLVIVEVEGATTDLYDQMVAGMDSHAGENTHPAVTHIAAVKPDGSVIVVDIWESPEAFGAHAENEIAPAAESVGISGVEPRIHPIHNTLKGATTTAQ